jgi:putative selenate reductase molybdopterin-binding subunit
VTLRRATGEAAFAADFTRPDTLHLAIRRSPLAHGRLVAADTADARAQAGVVTALTADEAGGLLDPVLRFVGDRAAVVAAEDPEIARRAADMIRLVVKPLPISLDPVAATREPDHVAARVDIELGDVDAALAEAEHVVEGTWSFPFTPAVTLEPPVALTWLDEDRRLVVRTSAGSPFRVRGLLADRLGLPAARIRVVRPLVAGSAGGRSDVHIEDLCGLVTLRTGRPARLALGAEEELAIAPGRPPQRVDVRLGLRGGRVSALALRLLVDVGGGAEGAEELLRSAGRQAVALYGAASFRFDAVAVRTHRPPMSTPHGADDDAAFALECAVAEASASFGEDGVTMRHHLLRRPSAHREAGRELSQALGEAPGADDTLPIAEVLRTGAEEVGWKDRTAERTPLDPIQRGLGVGLARRSTGAAGGTGAAASLRLLEDGSFALAAAPSSTGGADETAFTAAAASLLGIPTRRVVLAAADTDSAPFEAGDLTAAFFSAGRAVEQAAELARERIREAGAALLEADAEAVEVVAGEVRAADDRRVSFATIGASALRAGQPLVATVVPSAGEMPPSDAAVFAEIEVDTETGVVRPLRLTAAVAGGPFADPRPAEAQVEGALAAALERAVAAGLSFDDDGVPHARPLRSWPLVAAQDIPPISVIFVPTGDPSTRFGAVAVGDAAGRAAVAAIAGAVADATGGAVRSLPLDPGTVLDLRPDRSGPA